LLIAILDDNQGGAAMENTGRMDRFFDALSVRIQIISAHIVEFILWTLGLGWVINELKRKEIEDIQEDGAKIKKP
jgi:hypothetical protein